MWERRASQLRETTTLRRLLSVYEVRIRTHEQREREHLLVRLVERRSGNGRDGSRPFTNDTVQSLLRFRKRELWGSCAAADSGHCASIVPNSVFPSLTLSPVPLSGRSRLVTKRLSNAALDGQQLDCGLDRLCEPDRLELPLEPERRCDHRGPRIRSPLSLRLQSWALSCTADAAGGWRNSGPWLFKRRQHL